MNTTTYGLDIAKTDELYWVEPSGKCSNRRFSRPKLLEFLANREPGRIALEATRWHTAGQKPIPPDQNPKKNPT